VQERRPAPPLIGGPAGRPLLVALVAATVVVADQATKTWAVRRLAEGDIHVAGSLRFHLTYNSGGAFSLGTGNPWFFVAAAAVLLVVVLRLGRGLERPVAVVAVGLVVGGALGNVGDRLFRDLGGAVVDFVDLQWWPVFNVADMAVTVGAVTLALSTTRADRAR
jgi:signal peptidase II